MVLETPEHQRYNTPSMTSDGAVDGRWIACDESGYDGEQLLSPGRYMAVSAVAVDDVEAEGIVRSLRERARIKPDAPELKFKLFKRQDRADLLSELWLPGGVLHERCSVYLVDKRYGVMSKVVDLLLEEAANEGGIDLYADGQARRLARELFLQGPRALGAVRYEALQRAFVGFARRKDPGDRPAAIRAFYETLEDAWTASTRRNVTEVLGMLRSTRHHADEMHRIVEKNGPLELLITALATLTRAWAQRLRPLHVLADEHNALTDDVFDSIRAVLRSGYGPTPSSMFQGVNVARIVRGSSIDHPSIQLADLLAGAAGVVAEHSAGTTPSPFAEVVAPAILPLIEGWSLVAAEPPLTMP